MNFVVPLKCLKILLFFESVISTFLYMKSFGYGGIKPSITDKLYSDELCIPFLIYSIRDDEFGIYNNISV